MKLWRKAWWIIRYLGLRVVWLRLGVYIEKLTGRTRRVYASRPWDTLTLEKLCRPGLPSDSRSYATYRNESSPSFLFRLGEAPQTAEECDEATRQPAFSERLAALREMRCVYTFLEISPEPIDWYHNQFGGGRSDSKPLWCDVPLYLPDQGDPRTMWEPARAAWALDWATAAAKGFDGAADGLWEWIDSWMEACPPYHGIQWWCGQESSVRLLGILVGAWACGELNGDRWIKLLRLAWATGYRVEHHINYAISQKNNHAISEALGLMLVGHLFPELRESERWFTRGRQVMMEELRRQCYADGSYIQQSMNYHRVMLEGAMLGVRVAELAEQRMDDDIYEILGRAAEFLYQMSDPHTGRTPNYGNNDGAHIFPLSECDFLDVRPAVQAAYFVANRKRLLPPGPWDGELCWLMGPEVQAESSQAVAAKPLQSQAYDDGGYYTLRDSESDTWLMMRCHRYRDRMGQCDMLHVDLWAGGVNWLCDSGTYQYYIPGQLLLERYFGSQAAHNVLQIDGRDSGEKVGRFLIFPWANASCRHRILSDGAGGYIEGLSRDNQRAPWRCTWKRGILALGDGLWVIVDDVIGRGEHSVRWWWHLCPGNHQFLGSEEGTQLELAPMKAPLSKGMLAVAVTGDAHEATLIPAEDAEARTAAIAAGEEGIEAQGVVSPYYGHRSFIPVLQVDRLGSLPLRSVTVVNTRGSVEIVQTNAENWTVRTPSQAINLTMSPISKENAAPIILDRIKTTS